MNSHITKDSTPHDESNDVFNLKHPKIDLSLFSSFYESFAVTAQNPEINFPKSIFRNFFFPKIHFSKIQFPQIHFSKIHFSECLFSRNPIFQIPFPQNQSPEWQKTRKLIFQSSNPKNGKNCLKLWENLV